MNEKILEIAERIRGMRDICGISAEEMAGVLELSAHEYAAYERGERDFTFTFLYKVASRLGIDMTDLLSGQSPRLAEYFIVRKGEGMNIERRQGFKYESLAFQFKHRLGEPFIVTAKTDEQGNQDMMVLNSHEGQEFNYILSGSLRMCIDGHDTVLNEGDSVYYNANLKHGMVAVGGDCVFMAVIFNNRGNS